MNTEKLPEILQKPFDYLKNRLGNFTPEILITLGSGLSDVIKSDEIIATIPFAEIPNIAVPKVPGHKNYFEAAKINNKNVLIMRGRLHFYEGHSCDDIVRPARIASLLGIKYAILTNVGGSTSKKMGPGQIVSITDHINVLNETPLRSDEAKSLNQCFVDMSEPYDLGLRKLVKKAALSLKINVKNGVYAWMKGPQYETASEVRMLKRIGADMVGMSTVPEVIALRHLGVKVACLSIVTNYGTGVVKGRKLSHEEVKEIGAKSAGKLGKLINKLIGLID